MWVALQVKQNIFWLRRPSIGRWRVPVPQVNESVKFHSRIQGIVERGEKTCLVHCWSVVRITRQENSTVKVLTVDQVDEIEINKVNVSPSQ